MNNEKHEEMVKLKEEEKKISSGSVIFFDFFTYLDSLSSMILTALLRLTTVDSI
jgi:hypothetical protein